MTRDSGERGAGPSERRLPLDGGSIMLALLVLALLLRAFVAGVWLPFSGYRIDISDFAIWAGRMAASGPGEFYGQGGLTDYPPGYMYVLWVIGGIGAWLKPILGGVDVSAGLVKVPGMLADIGVGWLIFAYARRFGDGWLGRLSGERLGLVAAALYLFNPASIFNSAVWGQIDSVGALVVLGSLYLLARGWTEAAAAAAALALLIKFQYGFVLPIVAIVGIKRHLFGRSSDPAHDGKADPLRVLTSLAAGLGTLVGLILPFGMAIWAPGDPSHSLIGKFAAASETYKGLSLNAFNIWRNPWSGLGDTQQWGCDVPHPDGCVGQGIAFTLGSTEITWQLIGFVLFGLAAVVALWHVARRDDPRGLLVSALALAMAFFALPTRVHERYLFPALALAAPLIRVSRGWAVLFGVIAVSIFANVYWTYSADYSWYTGALLNPGMGGVAMQRDPFLAAVLFNDYGIYALSAMIVLALVWVLLRAWSTAGAADEALLAPMPLAPWPEPDQVASGADSEPPGPRPFGEPAPPRIMAAWRRFRAWLRPDPSDPLYREPPRRLDRRDAVWLIGLVLFALVFRLWRLELPRSTEFDEVYHGRSATEWLANWRFGWTRDAYEWTHPMLAKYLIAAGIELADPNQVVAGTDLPEAATALAVAPQRSAYSRVASIIFTADGGTTVTARESLSGEVVSAWDEDGSVAALAYDEDNNRLLLGLAESGVLSVRDLYAFLATNGERAPPPAVAPIDSGLSGVLQIEVPGSEPVLLFRGPDGIATVERVTGVPLASREVVTGGVAWVPGASTDTTSRPTRVVASDLAGGRLLVFEGATLQPETELFAGNGSIALPSPPVGPVLAAGNGKDLRIWVPVGPLPANDEHGPVDGGMTILNGSLNIEDSVPLPGAPRLVGWTPVANIIYVAGIQAGTGDPVVWTVQPRGSGGGQNAGFVAYDETGIAGEPLALGFDVSDHAEGDDHGRLVISTRTDAGGRLVAVDANRNAFAGRLAATLFGAVLVGLIYLLAATLFRQRRVAILAGIFVATDGLSFVMSRIAMNDIFVATFIVAAYLLFWQVWSGRWARSAWWALPLVGVLIGLASASKWVGWYALAGLLVLVLARSQLGRFLLVAGIGFITVASGVGAPWAFLVLCIATLALALIVTWRRPIQLKPADLWAVPAIGLIGGVIGAAFAIAYNQVDGREPRSAVELIFGLLARGAEAGWPAWLMLGITALLLAVRAIRSLTTPESDARWYEPAALAGFAWPWVGAALIAVPLVVYFVTYLPYLALGHSIAIPGMGPGYGWSLDELHSQMFGYHFGLTAGHASASPWWSWPLDLKPTWFYSHNFDGSLMAMVYNGGNPILFWAGVPAVILSGLLAWKRRSLALALVAAAFAFQYLPWVRIERVTFMYHYLTAVLFAMVAVAYLVDEALRSWEWRSMTVWFLVTAFIAGLLIFPLGSALAMPDWYVNAARALAPWNYGFQFPNPPDGQREQLLSADALKLAVAVLVSLGATAVALGTGRPFRRQASVPADGPADGPAGDPSGGGAPQGEHDQQDAQADEPDRP